MQLTTLPLDQLQPAPYNPRIPLKPGDPGFEKLRRSLDEFDLVQPVVWNRRTGHVVGGHQRLEVLRHAGRTEVDCVVVDLSLEREKALNVTLNNAEVGSDWDTDLLLDVIHDLQLSPDVDATLTGFDDSQLADLLLAPAPAVPCPADDDALVPDDIQATLEIPHPRWEHVRTWLDSFLADEPEVRLHIRLPNPTSEPGT